MDQNISAALVLLPLIGSFACGPWAVAQAARRTFGRGVAIIVLGIATGVAGLAISLQANQAQVAALRRAGHPVINDMPGFGQALLLGLGLCYFAAIFLIVAAAALWRRFVRAKSAKRRAGAGSAAG